MELQLEILSGRRKGERVSVLRNKKINANLPYVLETDSFRIVLSTKEWIDNPTVLLEDAEISLRPDNSNGEDFLYYADPIYKEGRPQSLFYNYFGVATFYLRYSSNLQEELAELGHIEVLARKATVSQIEAMVSFILSTDESELLSSRGATRRGADVASEHNDTPSRLLEKLESNILVLEEHIPFIVHRPITKLDTQLTTIPHNPYLDIEEHGISWLAENVSVLEQSTDPDATVLDWYGSSLAPTYVQTSEIYESADVYENQIIIGYIDNLLSFLQDLLKEENLSTTPRPSLNSVNGYVSFFGSIAERLIKNLMPERKRVLKSQTKLMEIRAALLRKLKVSKSNGNLPKFTPKVRANRVYSLVFRSIVDWYRGSIINWEARKMLVAIDNVPKLFELYTILLLRKWCQTSGESTEQHADCSWSGRLLNYKARLYYEPVIWASGHINNNASTTVFNTQVKTVNEAMIDNPSRIRRGDFQHRCPDIVLELERDDGKVSLLIFDAKYTKAELAFGTYLQECTIKYVHGIGSITNSSISHSMVILFPGTDFENQFLDFHMHPFSLFGTTPQKPILGALGLALKNNSKKAVNEIDPILSRIIELVS